MLRKILFVTVLILVSMVTVKAQIEPSFLIAPQEELVKREAWVDSVYNSLTLEERIGQMFIYTFAPYNNKQNIEHLKSIIADYKIGGVLFSGGEVAEQVKLTNLAQELSNVPLMVTFDGEWGLSMRLKNTPKFPRNMVLGSITDEALIYGYGKEMGRQCIEMGVHVNFAPVADVNINPYNPVINTRSFGESPYNVAEKVIAYSKGLESQNILSVAKHFPGHGDTNVDSHKSLPTLKFDKNRLDSIELYPFRALTEARLGGVMVGHLHIPALDNRSNMPSSLSKPIVDGVLKDSIGFGGLVFTDALEMKGVSSNSDLCLKAILAGNDMLLVPRRMQKEMQSILDAVDSGELSMELIEKRCKKILTYKYAMQLTKTPKIKLSGLMQRINTPEASMLIKELEEAAVTLIKNESGFTPITDSFKNIACLYTGDESDYKLFLDGIKDNYNVTTFHIPENYSVAKRELINKELPKYDRVFVLINSGRSNRLNTFMGGFDFTKPVGYFILMSGDKLYGLEEALSTSDFAILGHSTSDAVQQKVLDVIYGRKNATGKLAVSIGRKFPAGMKKSQFQIKKKPILAQELGLNQVFLDKIDTIALDAIDKKAFPGCQVTILKGGFPVYNKAFGTFTGTGSKHVSVTDLYDIASLSKTTGTLLAVMKLYDKGLINLTDYASNYLPMLKNTDKSTITIEELLFHESGMGAGLSVYNTIIDSKSYSGTLFRAYKDVKHPIQLGRRTWANPNFKFLANLTSKEFSDTYSIQVASKLWFNKSISDSIISTIVEKPLLSKKYRYSCLGFILLKQIVEEVSGESLDVFLDKNFYKPMGLADICYNPLQRIEKDRVVPSTNDKFFRKEVLQGFVHDELAALQGGVSGNAGQFASADAVASIYQLFLDKGFYKGQRLLSESTCELFTTKVSKISRRGLGFDKPNPDPNGSSACLSTVPIETYGHTGFTGSCAWADPVNDLVFVLVCNRTYPSQWPNNLAKYEIRDRMQQALYDAL